MTRALAYLVIVFLVAGSFAWLAARPGEVALVWQDYELRTSLMVVVLAIVLLVLALAFVGWLIRSVVQAPRTVGAFLGARRRDRGWRSLSAGMIAVGAGDARNARRAADEARSLLGNEPLVLLLAAQSAQLAGDGARARTAFEALAARPDTRLLGYHGLFIEARRQGEHEAARHFAEEAARAAPGIAWAGTALFEYRARAGDWPGAIDALAANLRAGVVSRPEADRLRASLLTARAIDLEAGEPAVARAAALEAHRLLPSLAPAAAVASRLLARAGDYRRAAKILEQAWKAMPSPDVADAYATVRPGDSVADRLKRMQRLAGLRANHPEGAMAVARAAIDARDFAGARAALDGLVRGGPSERVCLLMAEIEERDAGDQGKVRVWLARALTAPRDPCWIADGRAFDRWAPVSPLSGRVGAFEWRTPAEGAAPPREVREIEADFAEAADPPPETLDLPLLPEPANEPEPEPPLIEAKAEPAPPSPEPSQAAAPPEPAVNHAPDDPGPATEETPEERRRRFRLF